MRVNNVTGEENIMKKIIVIMLILGMTALASCSSNQSSIDKDAISGKTYISEKEGVGGGEFYITLKPDQYYEYYEGNASTYTGFGVWTIEDNLVVLDERSGYSLVFRFAVEGNALVYQRKGSSHFLMADVKDGDRFVLKKTE